MFLSIRYIIPSSCFIFSDKELAIQFLCLCHDLLDILHNLIGIILLSTLDTFQTRNILDYDCIITKYSGYIEREKLIAERLERLENIRIRDDFDYNTLKSITIEARQKLSKIRPKTLGQASRIPGVSPSDVNILLVYFAR